MTTENITEWCFFVEKANPINQKASKRFELESSFKPSTPPLNVDMSTFCQLSEPYPFLAGIY